MNENKQCGDFSTFVRLSKLKDSLFSLQNFINFQNAEILKTKDLIKEFEAHLEIQNEVLNMYIHKEKELTEEIDDIVKGDRGVKEVITEIKKIDFNPVRILQEISTQTIIESGIRNKFESRRPIGKMKQIKIAEINTEKIFKMFVYGSHIFVGGSNGIFLRYFGGHCLRYETNTNEDILQIEIFTSERRTSLIAFTHGKMMIYKNIGNRTCHQDFDLPGLGYVFNDGLSIYIPLKDGVIQRLEKVHLLLEDFAILQYGKVRSFVFGGFNRNISLLGCEDSLLFKAIKINQALHNVIKVKEVAGIRRIFVVMLIYFLYYSDDGVYVMDSVRYYYSAM